MNLSHLLNARVAAGNHSPANFFLIRTESREAKRAVQQRIQ